MSITPDSLNLTRLAEVGTSRRGGCGGGRRILWLHRGEKKYLLDVCTNQLIRYSPAKWVYTDL